ncbi:hypothetical protein PMNALOAF_3502 [Methylobacterium adhaesivum]|jgi:hypothetical protein|uniref:Uncharacterized protein n=1 Tax=Methylobacterium adhaesivum TaxID=333297 RepID=A0ABT8BL94_9HYPH|nr:hypothetical protein [Methylobacterium adhaesivum]MDN3592983.1 hypothetical protein [Methylobacterium adhaesivum]GJD32234.1 hypothetical protein PMNALOAF_3502 [Methylobacterium adhaesivum]
MPLIVTSTSIRSIRHIRVPITVRADNVDVPVDVRSVVSDGHRYGSIGSLQALGLAIVASVVTCAMLWLVL